MISNIVLGFELDAIKHFLTNTLEGVDTQIAHVFRQEEAGEFEAHLDDFSNALFSPLEQEAIAIRAVLYEINALVEWELLGIANDAYVSPGDKDSGILFTKDASIGKVCQLIEKHYQIALSDVPGWNEVQRTRQTVNAFKHSKGFKDCRRDPEAKVLDRFEPTRESAYGAIDGAEIFLRALWKKLKE